MDIISHQLKACYEYVNCQTNLSVISIVIVSQMHTQILIIAMHCVNLILRLEKWYRYLIRTGAIGKGHQDPWFNVEV